GCALALNSCAKRSRASARASVPATISSFACCASVGTIRLNARPSPITPRHSLRIKPHLGALGFADHPEHEAFNALMMDSDGGVEHDRDQQRVLTHKALQFRERGLARLATGCRHCGVKQLAVARKLDAAGVEVGVFAEQIVVLLARVRSRGDLRHAASALLGGAKEHG